VQERRSEQLTHDGLASPLDAVGHVAWWGDGGADVTLHRLLVHMATETHRHAGQADILRETIDGAVGLLPRAPNLPDVDAEWWPAYVARVEEAARAAAG